MMQCLVFIFSPLQIFRVVECFGSIFMYKCPKCGSTDTDKDRYLGSDTMDRVCFDCNYVGAKSEFRKPEKQVEND
ncbi:hypothetical protein ACED51_17005 [Photobacterium swingsii]|uniref:hypothetical protein n=1 Tax=Photobacterium swingsii TaxID=680026 RepID=UPI00352FB8B1